jgi:hypothetical protein
MTAQRCRTLKKIGDIASILQHNHSAAIEGSRNFKFLFCYVSKCIQDANAVGYYLLKEKRLFQLGVLTFSYLKHPGEGEVQEKKQNKNKKKKQPHKQPLRKHSI